MGSASRLLRDTRRRHGLSQAQLAFRAGTTQAAVSRIERGQVSPSIETVARLLAAMGEELVLASERPPLDIDPVHLAAERRLAPEQRLDRAFAWTEFNDQVRRAGARARR